MLLLAYLQVNSYLIAKTTKGVVGNIIRYNA